MKRSHDTQIESDLARITVIIPTFSRPDSVRRQFEYWSGSAAQVFILDGSPEPLPWAQSQQEITNVHYVHTGLSFSERRSTAWKFVMSEFAILLPDDEFHLESGLSDCVRYLDANPEVVGCAGKVLGFFVEQGEFRAFINYEDWLRFPDGCDSVRDRLDFALPPNKAHKVECSLFRSGVWKQIFSESYSTTYSCGFTYERLLNLYAAVLGRTELIDSVLWMRSLENPPTHSVDAPRLDHHNFVAWATSGEFQREVDHYYQKAWEMIRVAPDLSESEVDSYAIRFLFGGVQRQINKERLSQQKLSRKFGNMAIRLGPRTLKRLAKRYLPGRVLGFTGWRGERLEVLKRRLESRGIAYSNDDLSRVSELSVKSDSMVRVRDLGVGTQAAKGSRL